MYFNYKEKELQTKFEFGANKNYTSQNEIYTSNNLNDGDGGGGGGNGGGSN